MPFGKSALGNRTLRNRTSENRIRDFSQLPKGTHFQRCKLVIGQKLAEGTQQLP